MNLEERQREWKQLSEANRFEDPLDFFIRFIMIRGPTVYVLINITLVIWLVQTMLSSDLQQLPRSLFFFAPILTAEPINDIRIIFANESRLNNNQQHYQQHLHTLNFTKSKIHNHQKYSYNYNHQQETWVCPSGYQRVSLKWLPKITQTNIVPQNLTIWKKNFDYFQFCVRRINKNSSFLTEQQCLNASTTIGQGQIAPNGTLKYYCSGYCVANIQQCPITLIQKLIFPLNYKNKQANMHNSTYQKSITNNGQLLSRQTLLYPSQKNFSGFNGPQILTFTRTPKKGKPIVQLQAVYDSFCANDFKQSDQFNTPTQYWQSVEKCSNQAKLSDGIINVFDSIPTRSFLEANQVVNFDNILVIQQTGQSNDQQQSKDNPKVSEGVNLGFVREVTFDKSVTGCQKLAKAIRDKSDQKSFSMNSISSTYVQTILVSCFIFFVVCWFWLIGYYCCDGHAKQKNKIVILMAITQLIVISFIFYTNKDSFSAGKNWNKVASCISGQVKAAEEWNFGVESQRPFLSLIFANIVFLSIQLIAVIIDKIMYVSE